MNNEDHSLVLVGHRVKYANIFYATLLSATHTNTHTPHIAHPVMVDMHANSHMYKYTKHNNTIQFRLHTYSHTRRNVTILHGLFIPVYKNKYTYNYLRLLWLWLWLLFFIRVQLFSDLFLLFTSLYVFFLSSFRYVRQSVVTTLIFHYSLLIVIYVTINRPTKSAIQYCAYSRT